MYKLELNLELIKTNLKKFIWRVIDILKIQGFQIFFSSFWFSIICHASIGHTSNNPRVFFKRRFLINASFKANIFRLLLKNFFLINFYFSRVAESYQTSKMELFVKISWFSHYLFLQKAPT